jgi:hypothetical protein
MAMTLRRGSLHYMNVECDTGKIKATRALVNVKEQGRECWQGKIEVGYEPAHVVELQKDI